MNKDTEFLIDGHVHTLECGHAYNTIDEMARAAKDQGLEMIMVTEHGPMLYEGSRRSFFNNFKSIPTEIDGVRIIKGMEANILHDGMKKDKRLLHPHLDVFKSHAPKLEVVSASLHNSTFPPNKSMEENTEAVVEAIRNPIVDFVCHLGNPKYPIDYETVVKEAAKNGKILEINNGSFKIREGSTPNCFKIAELCKKYDVPIIVGSDAHHSSQVGKFPFAKKLLEVADFPDELIMNTDPEKMLKYLESRNKPTLGSDLVDEEAILKEIEEVARA